MEKFPTKTPEEFGFKDILYAKKDGVATVTINRPNVYNAYTVHTLREIIAAFEDAQVDDSIGVAVFTGAGDKAFCTGGDVNEYAGDYTQKPRDYWRYIGLFARIVETIKMLGKPTICRLNGMAAGGGNELNMACDLAVAADHITIRQVGTRVGSVAAGGATQWLPIIVGDRRARELLYLCEPITAQQALEWGLVNRVVPYAQLDDAVDEMCQKLLSKFPECLRYTQIQTNFWKDLVWHSTIGHARDWLSVHFTSAETYEGMKSFVEKRPTEYARFRKLAAEGKSSEFLWGPYAHTCPECGAKGIPSEFKFCGVCGGKLFPD
ncbi:MAG: enoyl-CoA hydratase/isomerase family protein [Chloroflexi bacterium]|nr:enoyl-CoA hydratase/isomerase family protein [Chloroflexota bacterium]